MKWQEIASLSFLAKNNGITGLRFGLQFERYLLKARCAKDQDCTSTISKARTELIVKI